MVLDHIVLEVSDAAAGRADCGPAAEGSVITIIPTED